MANILFLAHRIPYPPNKGDKIRSWHFFEHMCEKHRVHLGCFIDNPEDNQYRDKLSNLAESCKFIEISPLGSKLRALAGFMNGKPLSVASYPFSRMQSYVAETLNSHDIDMVFVFSGVMMEALTAASELPPIFLDLVDVDSAKWAEYSQLSPFPMNVIYTREFKTLAIYEKRAAQEAHVTSLVSAEEASVFQTNFDSSENIKIVSVPNGVDFGHFNPTLYQNRIESIESLNSILKCIFTGAMDYKPNIDAVLWFVKEVWPQILFEKPDAEFHIAGGGAPDTVKKLDGKNNISVLGRVPNMAEVLSEASIVIAPLQTARGVQNKVLEGMAMQKPVVATDKALDGIGLSVGRDAIAANTPDEFAGAVLSLADDPTKALKLGNNARQFVEDEYSWARAFAILDEYIDECREAK